MERRSLIGSSEQGSSLGLHPRKFLYSECVRPWARVHLVPATSLSSSRSRRVGSPQGREGPTSSSPVRGPRRDRSPYSNRVQKKIARGHEPAPRARRLITRYPFTSLRHLDEERRTVPVLFRSGHPGRQHVFPGGQPVPFHHVRPRHNGRPTGPDRRRGRDLRVRVEPLTLERINVDLDLRRRAEVPDRLRYGRRSDRSRAPRRSALRARR